MSKPNSQKETTESIQAIEESLKDFLDKVLSYFEKFIQTKEDLKNLENKLNDYENVQGLINIIKIVFEDLTEKIDQRIGSGGNENYDLLEKTVQKYEGEVRTHIGIEQQLKLYAESLQSKLDESEKARSELLDSTKAMINGVKRDNQKLVETVKQLKEENEGLSAKVKALSECEEKLTAYPSLQARVKTLEKMLGESKPSSSKMLMQSSVVNPHLTEAKSTNLKKVNLEVDYNAPQLKNDPSNSMNLRLKNSPQKSQARSNSASRPSSANKTNSTGNEEILKVKIEITKDKSKGDYGRYKSSSNNSNNRENRHPGSMSKGRESKSFMIPHSGHNSSNTSLIHNNSVNNSMHAGSSTGLHKRSKSTHSTQKQLKNPSKSKYDLSAMYLAAQQENLLNKNKGEQKSRYL